MEKWIKLLLCAVAVLLFTHTNVKSGGLQFGVTGVAKDVIKTKLQNSDPLELGMVQIPAGNFTMGLTSGNSDEQPAHTVYLDAYYIDKYEVTFEQYDRFCDATGRSKPSDDGWGRGSRPVTNVTWEDANAYAKWAGKRLPTEAEWEKAARGTDQRTYPWGEGIDSTKCNYNNNVGKTTVVGSYESEKSPYGCYDMAGNVWEWCNDWYGTYPSGTVNNPTGPATGSYRVLRGGSWNFDDYSCRSANRLIDYPYGRHNDLGFRCAQ
ncbi:MAG: formylglycine-generating enzyme family protein [Elusimicrobiota bacterium]